MATIVTRAGKGSPLTHNEVDANFTNLNTDKAESSALATVATSGAYGDLSGLPTLGTAAATAATAYATAAQGVTADAALPKAGGAMTGAITTNSTFDGRDVATDGTKLDGIEAAADVTDATNVTAAGALMDSELTTFGAVTSGRSVSFVLEVTAGGTHTLTWPGTVDWAGGSAPDAPASGVKNIYVFITRDGGTNWYGFLSGAAMA